MFDQPALLIPTMNAWLPDPKSLQFSFSMYVYYLTSESYSDLWIPIIYKAFSLKKQNNLPTQSFEHLHSSIFSFKQDGVVEWVEGTTHSH